MYKVKVLLVTGVVREFEAETDYVMNEDMLYWTDVYFPSTSTHLDTYSVSSHQVIDVQEVEIE